MSSSNVLEEELVIKKLQFLNENMKLSFGVFFHKNLSHSKSFSLNIIFSFFCCSFLVHQVFPWKIFLRLRKIVFPVRGKISKVDSSFKR